MLPWPFSVSLLNLRFGRDDGPHDGPATFPAVDCPEPNQPVQAE